MGYVIFETLSINLEPNCQYSSCSSEIVAKSLPPPQNLCSLSKHLPVFLLGTTNVVGGGGVGWVKNSGSGLW